MLTGHKSIEALRCYERISETQLLGVSHVGCDSSTPDKENICGKVAPYDDVCKSSSIDVVEIRDQQKDHMGVNAQTIVLCHFLIPVTPTFQTS